MKKSAKILLLACLLIVFVVIVLAYQAMAFAGNHDAFKEDAAELGEQNKELVERLVGVETAGMVGNEEGGVVYYHSSERTGKKNRVYLLWEVVSPESQIHDALVRALDKEKDVSGSARRALVAYVDLGFFSFRNRYKMQLGSYFADRGLGGMRAVCYRWDESASSWSRVGELANAVVLDLLTEQQKKAIRAGTFNMVNAISRAGPR